MQILRPAAGVLAFYDGRPERGKGPKPPMTWVENGAFSLGITSNAVVDRGGRLKRGPVVVLVKR
jgi:hypothetical protein